MILDVDKNVEADKPRSVSRMGFVSRKKCHPKTEHVKSNQI